MKLEIEKTEKIIIMKHMENNKQQTAIQSFWDKIALQLSIAQINEFLPEFEKAKEMHKEQIENAWDRGRYIGETFPQRVIMPEYENNSEEYYNETYGTE